MKKIIDNKVYDTDKATLVFSFKRSVKLTNVFGISFNDWVSGELYKTSKGNWFEVIGEDSYKVSTQLNALTNERAKEIISINADKYQELFGELEEA